MKRKLIPWRLGLPSHRPCGMGIANVEHNSLRNSDTAVLLESLELVQHAAPEIVAAIAPDKPLPPMRRLGCHSWLSQLVTVACHSLS
jgi:hypothetical protein